MTEPDVDRLFGTPGTGIAIICTNRRVVIDVEGAKKTGVDIVPEFRALVEESLPGLWDKATRVSTPSGGVHLHVRLSEPVTEGNKLASRLNADGRPETLIEIRRVGHYVLAPTCPGYELEHGLITKTATITDEEWDIFLSCARSFDAIPPPQAKELATNASPLPCTPTGADDRPGTEFNESGDVLGLLQRNGYEVNGSKGDEVYLRRPGKEGQGNSATLHTDTRRLWVYSSNAYPLEPDTLYTPHGLLAMLEHGGDYSAASRKLRADGFGGNQRPAKRQTTTGPQPVDDSAPRSERPVIRVIAGFNHEAAAEGEAALAAFTARHPAQGVYRRAGNLYAITRLGRTVERSGLTVVEGTQQLVPVPAPSLKLRLSEAAGWEKYIKTTGEWCPCDPPADIANGLAASPDRWPNTPYLVGLAECPMMLEHGGILSTPGYDRSSGLYYDPNGTKFPHIPGNPTKADAEAALAVLQDVIKGFPFADDASRSVALAAMLTPLIRQSVRSAPIFAFSAPLPASGKTLLATLPAYIATGRQPALISYTEDPAEEKKRYLALLVQGVPLICIDNVEKQLASDSLCTILTEPYWSERILGSTMTASVSTAVTWCATGNNLTLKGDVAERALLCYLDAGMEHPGDRRFDVNLYESTPAHRGQLVAAGLTILRAYQIATDKPKVSVFGRFEAWSRFCREPLIWLGQTDPCDSRKAITEADPASARLEALLWGWRAMFGSAAVTPSEAIRQALATAPLDDNNKAAHELMEAIMEIADQRGKPSSRFLNSYIKRYQKRIQSGLRFISDGTAWFVEPAGITKTQALDIMKRYRVRMPSEGALVVDSESDIGLIREAGRVLGYLDIDIQGTVM